MFELGFTSRARQARRYGIPVETAGKAPLWPRGSATTTGSLSLAPSASALAWKRKAAPLRATKGTRCNHGVIP